MQYIVTQCIIYGQDNFFDALNHFDTPHSRRFTYGGNAPRGSNRAQADCSALLAAIFAEVFRVIFLIILFVNFVSPCLATDNIEPFPAVMQGTFAQGIKSQAVPIPVDTAGSSISICVF